jgi:hypothetical protein
MLHTLVGFWDWYISGFESYPSKSLYESPRFWRVALTLTVLSLASQIPYIMFFLWALFSFFIALICWIFFTKKGQSFLHYYNEQRENIKAVNNKVRFIGDKAFKEIIFLELMNEFNNLSTFQSVAAWDKKAESEIQHIAGIIYSLNLEIEKQSKNITPTKIKLYQDRYCAVLENMAEKLQIAIDFTPNSATDKKMLLQELHQRKKELQIQKRELNIDTKQIRNIARVKSAHAGRFLGIMYDSKLAASERRSIRYKKEALVAPYESLKVSIDRQILQIDKDILWIENITSQLNTETSKQICN